MKRIFDLFTGILIFISFSPIMVCTAILVRWKLGTPIIFKQLRPGLYGTPFYIYKFRTMTNECDSSGELLPDDQRLTPVGKFIRKYSLDESIQLWNVIKGELSLVGPRPLLMEYLPLYNAEQFKRHLVKPGITGWAQINGRNSITWEEKFQLDVWYVENQSFFLDLKILFITLIKVIKSDGIQNSDSVTMPVFKGSSGENSGESGALNVN
ncbi:sugar transferase [Neobacillus muris]|uniref:sugar transferase n=1 Tax=Neobacillus muris TaxID=2941334 RepID=UPI0024084F70|nr:sugar transferase [Neobacillus muris]